MENKDKPAQVTMERFEVAKSWDNTLSCPICGRWSQFKKYIKENAT